MGVTELGHVVLYVENAERSARFYRDVLGWHQILPEADEPVVGRWPPSRGAGPTTSCCSSRSARGRSRSRAGRRLGMYHFGLKVGESPTTSCASRSTRVRAAGAKILGASDHHVTHSLYIADPDGNEVELFVDVPGLDWKNDPTLIMAPTQPLRHPPGFSTNQPHI